MRKSLSIITVLVASLGLSGCIYKDILTNVMPEKKVETVSVKTDPALVKALEKVSVNDCDTLYKMYSGLALFLENGKPTNSVKVTKMMEEFKTLYGYVPETAKEFNDLTEPRLVALFYEGGTKSGKLVEFESIKTKLIEEVKLYANCAKVSYDAKRVNKS